MSRVCVIGLAGTSAFLRVPRFHAGGETVHADALHVEYGGKGFNQVVAAARWGAETSFLTAVVRRTRSQWARCWTARALCIGLS